MAKKDKADNSQQLEIPENIRGTPLEQAFIVRQANLAELAKLTPEQRARKEFKEIIDSLHDQIVRRGVRGGPRGTLEGFILMHRKANTVKNATTGTEYVYAAIPLDVMQKGIDYLRAALDETASAILDSDSPDMGGFQL